MGREFKSQPDIDTESTNEFGINFAKVWGIGNMVEKIMKNNIDDNLKGDDNLEAIKEIIGAIESKNSKNEIKCFQTKFELAEKAIENLQKKSKPGKYENRKIKTSLATKQTLSDESKKSKKEIEYFQTKRELGEEVIHFLQNTSEHDGKATNQQIEQIKGLLAQTKNSDNQTFMHLQSQEIKNDPKLENENMEIEKLKKRLKEQNKLLNEKIEVEKENNKQLLELKKLKKKQSATEQQTFNNVTNRLLQCQTTSGRWTVDGTEYKVNHQDLLKKFKKLEKSNKILEEQHKEKDQVLLNKTQKIEELKALFEKQNKLITKHVRNAQKQDNEHLLEIVKLKKESKKQQILNNERFTNLLNNAHKALKKQKSEIEKFREQNKNAQKLKSRQSDLEIQVTELTRLLEKQKYKQLFEIKNLKQQSEKQQILNIQKFMNLRDQAHRALKSQKNEIENLREQHTGTQNLDKNQVSALKRLVQKQQNTHQHKVNILQEGIQKHHRDSIQNERMEGEEEKREINFRIPISRRRRINKR